MRIGATALLGEPEGSPEVVAFEGDDEDATFPMRVEYFAELEDGRRIETGPEHGCLVVYMRRRGLAAIHHRYYGPPVDDFDDLDRTYRVRESDVVDAINEQVGKDPFESDPGEESFWRRVAARRWEWTERRECWSALRKALREHGVSASVSELDGLPFGVEISDEVRAQLAYD